MDADSDGETDSSVTQGDEETGSTAAFVFAGYSFDFRRLKWWDWLIILLTVWFPFFAVGWAIGRSARRIEE